MGIAFLLDFYYTCCMWIKQIKKQNSAKGKAFYQYQLTQSSRIEGKVQHIAVLYLGSHPLLHEKTNRKILARLLKSRINGQASLEEASEELIKLADEYYEKYLIKNPDNQPVKKSKEAPITYEEVKLSSTQVENTREIGSEWMVRQMADYLDVTGALQRKGWSKKQADLALVSIISRAVAAFSEHKTAQWLANNSGLMELFSFSKNYRPTRHHLYQVATNLYQHKDFLEEYLYQRTMNMFGLEEKVIIFDLTNTYFEGVKAGSELAQYGKNKEKRNDCKQMVLAGVVNSYGMLKYSQIYEGNMSDTATLEGVITSLGQKAGKPVAGQTLVMDAGIASEANLKFLEEQGLKYICVTQKKLKDYQVLVEGETVAIQDKRKGRIDLKVIKPEGYHDTWMYVKSQGKQAKEQSINHQKKQRFEEELKAVKTGIHKKGGTKQYGKVMERIGRIKERYPMIHKYYKLTVNHDDNHKVTDFHWEIKDTTPKEDPGHGVYFLRTNYKEKIEEKQMWQIYNTIREVEATFRTLKNDLHLRPIYHQEDEYMQAHLFLGTLAYQLVAAIRYQLKQHGINHDWKNIVRIMNTQKVMTVKQKAKTKDISLRLCNKPIQEAQDIYNALNFKHMPFATKKFVVYH